MAAAPTAAVPTPNRSQKNLNRSGVRNCTRPSGKKRDHHADDNNQNHDVPTAMTCIQPIFLISSIVQSVAFFRASRAASTTFASRL